ncbi:unnamed protein product [Phytophthora fragariaefolia]|uniref:Unnamed protein product n=1 Tax=Phytophthora fragariaefolia TaxID=1490495 RepID=A0A9W7CUA6_9STRA|nr:unnamed protein product [Phytophthora fragariaefolia]
MGVAGLERRHAKGDAAVLTVVDTQVEQEWPVTEGSDLGASAPGADAIGPNTKGRSAVRRRGRRGASTPGADAQVAGGSRALFARWSFAACHG